MAGESSGMTGILTQAPTAGVAEVLVSGTSVNEGAGGKVESAANVPVGNTSAFVAVSLAGWFWVFTGALFSAGILVPVQAVNKTRMMAIVEICFNDISISFNLTVNFIFYLAPALTDELPDAVELAVIT
jgi:hypothetical protein